MTAIIPGQMTMFSLKAKGKGQEARGIAQRDLICHLHVGDNYCLTNPAKWKEAEAEAVNLDGYLVTIDNITEDWLLPIFGNVNPFWIGFTDEKTEGNFEWVSDTTTVYTKKTEGNFEWVSDTTTVYTNWSTEEPNNGNSYGDEHYAAMWNKDGSWNDINNNGFGLDCSDTSLRNRDVFRVSHRNYKQRLYL